MRYSREQGKHVRPPCGGPSGPSDHGERRGDGANAVVEPGDARLSFGQRIRALRLRQNLTLVELSRRAGYTPGFISQVERDITNPSITSITRIAESLGVPVGTFLDRDNPKDPVVRRNERRRIMFFRRRAADYILTPSLAGHLQVIYTEVLPAGNSGPEPHTHESDEEFALVLRGRLRFWVGANQYLLDTGDSITFSSRIPHRWENAGRGKAAVLWAMTPPSM
jgi:transcriptional regulator with XRE-family HTH domain